MKKQKQTVQASPFIYKLCLEVNEGYPVLTEDRFDFVKELKRAYVLRNQFDKSEHHLTKTALGGMYTSPGITIGYYAVIIYCLAEDKLKTMRVLKKEASRTFSKENEQYFKKARVELDKLKW